MAGSNPAHGVLFLIFHTWSLVVYCDVRSSGLSSLWFTCTHVHVKCSCLSKHMLLRRNEGWKTLRRVDIGFGHEYGCAWDSAFAPSPSGSGLTVTHVEERPPCHILTRYQTWSKYMSRKTLLIAASGHSLHHDTMLWWIYSRRAERMCKSLKKSAKMANSNM